MPLHRARVRRVVAPVLVLILVLVCGALAMITAAPVLATPPRPPLDLRIVLLEAPPPGRDVSFAIEVTPLIPGAELRVSIVPPADVSLVRGRRIDTRRDLAPGRLQRFEAAVRVPPGRRRHVYVRAELVTAGGRRYTRGEHLVVLAGALVSPDPAVRVVPDGRGGTLVEHEAARGNR